MCSCVVIMSGRSSPLRRAHISFSTPATSPFATSSSNTTEEILVVDLHAKPGMQKFHRRSRLSARANPRRTLTDDVGRPRPMHHPQR